MIKGHADNDKLHYIRVFIHRVCEERIELKSEARVRLESDSFVLVGV